jgi:ribosomal protein S18 acetylase RimI-like enzyme
MVEAMQRTLAIAENAGIIGLFVDAKNEAAKTYYERFGFVSLEEIPLELFLPLPTIRQLVEPS